MADQSFRRTTDGYPDSPSDNYRTVSNTPAGIEVERTKPVHDGATAVSGHLVRLQNQADAILGWARASLCDAIAGGGRGTQLRDLEALAQGHALQAAAELTALASQPDDTVPPEVGARLRDEYYVPPAPGRKTLDTALRALRAEYGNANNSDLTQAREVLAAARKAGLAEQVPPRPAADQQAQAARLRQGAERTPDRGAATTRAAESADAFRWIAALHPSEWPARELADPPGFAGFERVVRNAWQRQTGKRGWTIGAVGRQIAAGIFPEPRGRRTADVLPCHPAISCLGDAPSNPRTDNSDVYVTYSGEQLRSGKSILLRHHFTNENRQGLVGTAGAEVDEGLGIFTGLVNSGLRELGQGDIDLGAARMDLILEVHDIAKSEAVAAAVENRYGITDHDMALPALIADNFAALENVVSNAVLHRLRTVVAADPEVRAFLGEKRGIRPTFNIGRHLRGEADFMLFADTVSDTTPVAMAEFVLDLLGSDGNANPDGPARFSNIPGAFNGIAAGLDKLRRAMRHSATADLFQVWEELSYPAEDLARLGLGRDNEAEIAITRIAFMGSEHQHPDTAVAHSNITDLRNAFAATDSSVQQRITRMLGDRAGLDLGFAPHVLESMRTAVSPHAAYHHFLAILDQLSSSPLVADAAAGPVTINLDNKYDWSRLVPTTSVSVAVDGPDAARVLRASFAVPDTRNAAIQ